MHKRLQLLLKDYSLTSAKFADIIGIQPSAISHLISGRNKPSFDLLSRILTKFPEINPRWLILGETPVYISEADGEEYSESMTAENIPVSEGKDTENSNSFSFPLNFEIVSALESTKAPIDKTDPTPASENLETNNKKKIENIIVFYSDGTFEYFDRRSR